MGLAGLWSVQGQLYLVISTGGMLSRHRKVPCSSWCLWLHHQRDAGRVLACSMGAHCVPATRIS